MLWNYTLRISATPVRSRGRGMRSEVPKTVSERSSFKESFASEPVSAANISALKQ